MISKFVLPIATVLLFIAPFPSDGCHIANQRLISFGKNPVATFFGDCLSRSVGRGFRWAAIARFAVEDTTWFAESGNNYCGRGKDTDACWEGAIDLLVDPSSPYSPYVKRCIREYEKKEKGITSKLDDDTAALQGEFDNSYVRNLGTSMGPDYTRNDAYPEQDASPETSAATATDPTHLTTSMPTPPTTIDVMPVDLSGSGENQDHPEVTRSGRRKRDTEQTTTSAKLLLWIIAMARARNGMASTTPVQYRTQTTSVHHPIFSQTTNVHHPVPSQTTSGHHPIFSQTTNVHHPVPSQTTRAHHPIFSQTTNVHHPVPSQTTSAHYPVSNTHNQWNQPTTTLWRAPTTTTHALPHTWNPYYSSPKTKSPVTFLLKSDEVPTVRPHVYTVGSTHNPPPTVYSFTTARSSTVTPMSKILNGNPSALPHWMRPTTTTQFVSQSTTKPSYLSFTTHRYVSHGQAVPYRPPTPSPSWIPLTTRPQYRPVTNAPHTVNPSPPQHPYVSHGQPVPYRPPTPSPSWIPLTTRPQYRPVTNAPHTVNPSSPQHPDIDYSQLSQSDRNWLSIIHMTNGGVPTHPPTTATTFTTQHPILNWINAFTTKISGGNFFQGGTPSQSPSALPPVITGSVCDNEAMTRFANCVKRELGTGGGTGSLQRSSLFSGPRMSLEDMDSIFNFFENNYSKCQPYNVQLQGGNRPTCRRSHTRSIGGSITCLPTIMVNLVRNQSRLRNIFLKCASP